VNHTYQLKDKDGKVWVENCKGDKLTPNFSVESFDEESFKFLDKFFEHDLLIVKNEKEEDFEIYGLYDIRTKGWRFNPYKDLNENMTPEVLFNMFSLLNPLPKSSTYISTVKLWCTGMKETKLAGSERSSSKTFATVYEAYCWCYFTICKMWDKLDSRYFESSVGGRFYGGLRDMLENTNLGEGEFFSDGCVFKDEHMFGEHRGSIFAELEIKNSSGKVILKKP